MTDEYDKFSFSTTDVDLLLHATEDKNLVFDKIEQILFIPKDIFNIVELEGHWGNPIISVSCTLDKLKSHDLIFKIFSSLNFNDKEKLTDNLEDYMDEKYYLYMRIDKQHLCKNKISLDPTDDSIKLRFKPSKKLVTKDQRKIIPKYYRRLLLLQE
ncbi:MAG: RNA-binding domain-containing protein [Nitrososphaeraceae archaeon]